MSIAISEFEMGRILEKFDCVESCKYEDTFYFVYPNFYLRKRYNVGLRRRENHVLMHINEKGMITEVEGEENIYDYLLEKEVSYIYLDMPIFKMKKYFERFSGTTMFIDIFKGGGKILATGKSFGDYTPDKSFFSIYDERKSLTAEDAELLKIWNSDTYPFILYQKRLLREKFHVTEPEDWKAQMRQIRESQLCHPHHQLYKNLWHVLYE
jgi:hypothetical protein